MKSTLATKGSVDRKWYLVDADDKILGRLAPAVAEMLMGKNKPIYTPNVDTGDFVVVVNAEKIRVTGKKAETKKYQRYTGYSSGQKTISFETMIASKPERVIELAVKRMLPKNKLGNQMIKKLKVFRGPEHNHAAQQPEKIEI
ncbi:MAG TPA: 50S ribosomal protein L13 [Anaerohalosphaeraceae bacterium]|jgi:large subunit ribosomal protein L13|nr:50S ribosomal protein L13 [Anaerohalosphaeraceae bacterium]HRT50736.1 50S ribosomal protein L13 [Anaerohalosphaeraceae bacterium]HRT86911.1 50S ribosomal protein L13 [Anaerohalosphaeraceae bacterium]